MMKTLRLAFIAVAMFAAPYVAAEGYISHRIISTPAVSLPLPEKLNFTAHEIEVVNAGWMNSIFDYSGCESALSAKLEGEFSLEVAADHSLKILWRGRSSALLKQAYSAYIPVHFHYGQEIPAHTLVQLPGYVTLHIELTKTSLWGTRTLTVSVVQNQRHRKPKLLPVLIAQGR